MRLLVKNNPNRHNTGDIIFIGEDSHIFGKMESLSKFISMGGNKKDWTYEFVIVNVPSTPSRYYSYLSEIDENGLKRFYLEQQGFDSPYWDDISNLGEVTITVEEFDSLIRRRF